MALFMDRHDMTGATPSEVAEAHWCDLEIEARHQVRFLTYWHHNGSVSGFCLVEAPSAQAVTAVHREAHEGIPSEIVEVDWHAVQAFLGPIREPVPREPWEDFATRAILCVAMDGEPGPGPALGESERTLSLRAKSAVARRTIGTRGGRHVADDSVSVIGCFSSGSAAIECALALHAAFVPMASIYQREPTQLRIGISLGEPVDGRFGLFGAALKVAAGLCHDADPGVTLVSGEIRSLPSSSAFDFTHAGASIVEGIEAAVTRYRLDGRSRRGPEPLSPTVRLAGQVVPNGLSPREVDVLRMIAVGKTNKEIAGGLCISLSTVATHVRNLFEKAGVANRAEAASFAYRSRLV